MSGYRRYLRDHYWACQNHVSKKEMESKYQLIVKLKNYMDMVDYSHELTELQENLGWRWYHPQDDPTKIHHHLRYEHISILNAIENGNLMELKTLNNEGNYIGFYKQIMIRLAVKFKHIDIINYLLNTNQLNVSLSEVIGKLDDGTVLEELFKVRNIDKFILSGERDDLLPTHMPLWEWYESMKYIDVKDVYISALIENNNILLDKIKNFIELDKNELKNDFKSRYEYQIEREECRCHTICWYINSSGKKICSHCYFTELLQNFDQ